MPHDADVFISYCKIITNSAILIPQLALVGNTYFISVADQHANICLSTTLQLQEKKSK